MKDFVSDLDAALLRLPAGDTFTLRDACEGVHVLGGIGSGKSSGTGPALIAAYLRAGMGGIVLAAKPEDIAMWQRAAEVNGRGRSVIVFDETQGFNFITYELLRHGTAGIGNVVECLMRVLETADQVTGVSATTTDPFWPQAIRQVLSYSLPVIHCAYGEVTVTSVLEFVISAAHRREQYADEGWCRTSYAAQTLLLAGDSRRAAIALDEPSLRPWLEYWFKAYPAIPEKTRGNIVISLSAKLDRFRHGRLERMFCGATTVLPEMTFQGAIILMATPVLTWNEDGVIAQQLFKFMWQRAVEARNGLDAAQRLRPVFLFGDESQYWISPKDDEFLSTCRSSRACVVYMTQSLPSYYARLGKDRTDAVNGLVGKFATQVFHRNACSQTNKFASDLIGRGMQRRSSGSTSNGASFSSGVNEGSNTGRSDSRGHGGSSGGQGGTYSTSHNDSYGSSRGESYGRNAGRSRSTNETEGWSEHLDNLIEPNFFATALKAGGPANGNRVTALWFRAGARFAGNEGRNFFIGEFRQ